MRWVAPYNGILETQFLHSLRSITPTLIFDFTASIAVIRSLTHTLKIVSDDAYPCAAPCKIHKYFDPV